MLGYEVEGIILNMPVMHTVNYYDGYDFLGMNGMLSSEFAYEDTDFGTRYPNAKMRLTGTATAILDGSPEQSYLYSVMYYDDHDRIIQQKSTNILGGIDKQYTAYDFTGHPLRTMHVHSVPSKTTQTESYIYSYDHANRLTQVTHSLNGGDEVVLASNTYDDAVDPTYAGAFNFVDGSSEDAALQVSSLQGKVFSPPATSSCRWRGKYFSQ